MPNIDRGNVYTMGGHSVWTNGSVTSSVETPMQIAINKGVWGSFDKVSVANCASGNCSFTEYRTLAMRGECQLVTDELEIVKMKNTTGQLVDVWQLPESDVQLVNGTGVVLAIATRGRGNTTKASMTRSDILIDIDPQDDSGEHRHPPKIEAYRCSLTPCMRAYAADVIKGSTIEHILWTRDLGSSNFPLPAFSKADPTFFNYITIPCLINGTEWPASHFTQNSGSILWEVQGLLPKNQTAWLPEDCIFQYDAEYVVPYLEKLLTGQWTYNSSRIDEADPSWLRSWDVFFYALTDSNETLAMINNTYESIANSMSAQFRTHGTPAKGRMWAVETCIHVQWYWLIYPTTLLIASTLLLGLSIFCSQKDTPRNIWKSSPLALLAHGLDDRLQGQMREFDRTSDLVRKAGELHAQLRDTGHGNELTYRPAPYSAFAMVPSMLELVHYPQPVSQRDSFESSRSG